MKKYKARLHTGVGIGDLVGFIRVEPNLSLTTLEDATFVNLRHS
jgi:hypothetical protein